MKVGKVTLTHLEDFTQGMPVLCTDIRTDKAYKNGKPTDEVTGTRYELVFTGLDYEKAFVKTPELIPAFSVEAIKKGGVPVEIVGFSARAYTNPQTQQADYVINARTVRLITA